MKRPRGGGQGRSRRTGQRRPEREGEGTKKAHQLHEGEMIYGLQAVLAALKAGKPMTALWIARSQDKGTRALIEAAEQNGVAVELSDRPALDRRAGSDGHQGVLALVSSRKELDDEVDPVTILDRAEAAGEPPLVLVLDEVQDPRNFGALIRTAHALGAHGVVIGKHRSAPLSPTAIKASAGASEALPIARVTNIKHALGAFRERGLFLAAASIKGQPVGTCRLDGPLAIVVGSEGKDVRPSVQQSCDFAVSIPLARGFDSLNVSVAAGILLFEARRQRQATPP